MTKEERAMLREAAEKALNIRHAVGTWQSYWRKTEGEADCGVFTENSPGHAYSICRAPRYSTKKDWESIGQHIAASNPATILSLLDALDGAERDAAELKEHPETWKLIAYFESEGAADLAADRIVNLAGGIVLTEGPTPKDRP